MASHVYAQVPGRGTRRFDLPSRFDIGALTCELKDFVGGGGNSAVFRVHVYEAGKFVGERALKVLKQLDAVREDRFKNEVRLLREFSHSRISKFYGEGTVRGNLYVDPEGDRDWSEDEQAVDLPCVAIDLGGNNIRRHVETAGAFQGAAFKTAALDMCEAVAHLHEREVIHRDIKPENFVLDPRKPGHVFMIDFGIAKYIGEDVAQRPLDNFTKQKEFVGPHAFCSPELLEYARDKSALVDGRSDLFQLGKVLWFMATGFVSAGIPSKKLDPFGGSLHALVSSLLCDEPADRPGSIAELQQTVVSLPA